MKKVDLVGVGLNATDTLIPLAAFPLCGSKVEYSTETVMPGGQTASAVVALPEVGRYHALRRQAGRRRCGAAA